MKKILICLIILATQSNLAAMDQHTRPLRLPTDQHILNRMNKIMCHCFKEFNEEHVDVLKKLITKHLKTMHKGQNLTAQLLNQCPTDLIGKCPIDDCGWQTDFYYTITDIVKDLTHHFKKEHKNTFFSLDLLKTQPELYVHIKVNTDQTTATNAIVPLNSNAHNFNPAASLLLQELPTPEDGQPLYFVPLHSTEMIIWDFLSQISNRTAHNPTQNNQ